MISYKIFVDRYGTLLENAEYEEAKKYFDYAVDQKKKGVGKFIDKTIYFMKVEDGAEVTVKTDAEEKFSLGGEVVNQSLSKNLINRYINGCAFDAKIFDKQDGYYDSGNSPSLFLNHGGNFVKSISKDGSVFIVYKSAIKAKEKIEAIVDCMKIQNVHFKIA